MRFGFWIIEITGEEGVLYASWPTKEAAQEAAENDPTIADDILAAGRHRNVEFKYVNNIQRLNALEITTPDPVRR